MKKHTIIIFILITVLLFPLISCNKNVNENGYKYISDIDYLDAQIKSHPNSFINYDLSEEEYDKKINELKEDINKNYLSDFDINYKIKEIFSMTNNSHAYMYESSELLEKDNYFPFLGSYFDDDYYITACSENLKDRDDFLSSKLISINDIPMDEIEKRYDKIISNDNKKWLKYEISQTPFRESAFKYLKILQKRNVFKCELSDGSTKEFEISPVDSNRILEILNSEDNYININKENLIKCKKPDNMSSLCWFKIDSKNRALYFNYGTCTGEYDMIFSEKQSDVDFNKFNNLFTDFVNSSNSQFDKIIIDLRYNEGGFIKYFEDIVNNNSLVLNSKKVYVLIGKGTFSAGTIAANTAVEKCNALLIGEETGGAKILNPAMPFKLSETQSTVSIPANFNIDNSSAGRNCKNNKDGLIPDIKITHSINNLINGIDEDYEAAINN